VIRLATHFAVGSGREGVIRLTLTAVGIALATVMLLCAAVAYPALHAHEIRRGWMDTSAHNRQPAQDETTTDPLLWRMIETRFDGRDLVRVDVAAEGPDAPVPPGLDALPADGSLAASPALRRLLDRTDPALLADRFPGLVTATVGREALAAPDDLVVFVGRSPDDLRTEPGVRSVRSIEAAPTSLTLTRVMRLAIAVGTVGLLAPVVVFVATATRLAAARRERRLAAMRLAGATPDQVSVVAAVEAGLAALAGVAAGFGLFFAIRPWLARIPLDGAGFYPEDLRLSWGWAAAVALGVPLLAIGAAVVSLRHARISPLGVTRRATRARPSPAPLLLVVAGMAGLLLVQATMTRASASAQASAIAAALLAIIAGIVLSGAWLTSLVGRVLAGVGRRAPSLLAARRLQDNPAAGFRAIGGLILAVFVGTVFSSFAASVLADDSGVTSDGLSPGVVVGALQPCVTFGQGGQCELPESPEVQVSRGTGSPPPSRPGSGGPVQGPPPGRDVWPVLEAADQARLVRGLHATPGVEQVTTAHALPDELLARLLRSDWGLIGLEAAAMACPDVAAVGLPSCHGTTALNIGGSIQATGVDVTDALPVEALADEPVVAFAVTTDGSTTAIEQVRTLLERAIPGSKAVTQADIDADNEQTTRNVQRISHLALTVTLVIAGCSLAVAVAGSIVERRQPFALLRLAGTRLSDLRRVVLAEAAAPLLMVATATSALGLAVTALTLASDTSNPAFALPGLDYWLALVGGLAIALAVVAATLRLLNRLTSPESVRIE
jgi:hypothetical protein